jgi:hypothetical protein
MSDLMRLTHSRLRSQDDGLPTRRDACGSNALATLEISGGHTPNRRNRSGVSIPEASHSSTWLFRARGQGCTKHSGKRAWRHS